MATVYTTDLRAAEYAPIHTVTADGGPMKPATKSMCFFDLPTELRLEIYEFAFVDYMETCQERLEARANEHATQLVATGQRLGEMALPVEEPTGPLPPLSPLRHPLLRANKKVYAEILPLHLKALFTYLEAIKTAEREALELDELEYSMTVETAYESVTEQRSFSATMRAFDRGEIRPVFLNCMWWILRDENDRVSSELNRWYDHIKWIDSGDIKDDWREDEIHRTGIRKYPVVQAVYNWKAKTGPRHHPTGPRYQCTS